jgi:hypothetical protein
MGRDLQDLSHIVNIYRFDAPRFPKVARGTGERRILLWRGGREDRER